MALSMVNESAFAQGQTANGPDVSAEVKNILNNPVTLMSPLTGNLDVNAKQLLSMIPENTSSDPTGGTEGELYYHTGRDRLVWWDGTASHTGASLDHAQTFRAKQTFGSPIINTSILGTAISDINPPVVNSSVASAGTSATVSRRDHKHAIATPTKVGSFTRDISLTGSQAITGVGFTPKAIIFFAAIATTKGMSVGFVASAGASAGAAIADYGVVTADTWYPFSYAIGKIYTAGTDGAYADLASFDADGFTLTWAKDGSPTGTATVQYLAIG